MKILFVYQDLSSFVKKDIDILKSAYPVKEFYFRGFKDISPLFKEVLECDMTFSWFGKLHAFFAILFSKILRKKSIVVAGGDDVAKKTPSGRPYGLFGHPVKRWFGWFIFKYADLVISISKNNYREIIENTPVSAEKIRFVYHGFDYDMFYKFEDIIKDDVVVTIGHIDKESYWRKGYYLIKKVANLMPEIPFYIIGLHKGIVVHRLQKNKPRNLFSPGALYGKDLIKMLSRAKVYLQLSEWESFGCALAEAMLCECAPVVSRIAALEEVVGASGIYINSFTPQEIANKVGEAIHRQEEIGPKARQRIIKEFPLEKRKEGLVSAVKEALEG